MKISTQQTALILINVVGGILVVGSYVWGLKTHPQIGTDALWGGIPLKMRNLYAVSMLLAAIGYFLFTFYILFKINPAEIKIANIFGFTLFQLLYILILLPSAIWMPLTFKMLEAPSPVLWIAIRIVLAVVALGALAIIISLLTLNPRQSGSFYWLALAGIIIFFLHTGILDALIWANYFKTT